MNEGRLKTRFIKKIKARFPDCMVLKNDANYIQGVPDLLVLNDKNWAAFEYKCNARSKKRPNQDYYISKMDKMSYAAFVYPEIEEEVLDELSQAFRT